mmetsp:Transcript_28040/g.79268  ORF Transcript_28040/g.79268 Transcript_28040/m.79268 type:complete len:491 (-) Transcript_28040:356-1828(-)|eukprot:CAMPEP_0117650728 /NCGR_PEP_ID=MMETSP0804-20121206/1695_1 /TAXON_ID=1074897 /ORGANISM="Tetraselmis astigmatica, Strain CCMP880" /LENGTH=490 /DNA_ID=CAMNT_0005456621 /DNA_START=575 /DNA_END=2047 /DNA_ORIENTATION=+
MTKSGKKAGSKVSLKSFYEQVPGNVPAEECLPSKPVRREYGFNVGAKIAQPRQGPQPIQHNLFYGHSDVFNPAGTLADPQNLGLRPQHTCLPPSLANQNSHKNHQHIPTSSPPRLNFHHRSSGLAPGAVGYGTSFPDNGVTLSGGGILYPNCPQGQQHAVAGYHAPPQPWAPHLQQQQLYGHHSAQQNDKRDMLQLHGPVRAQSMPGLQITAAAPPPPPPKQHSTSQANLPLAQDPAEAPVSTHWAEQAAQGAVEQLSISKSSLVELKPDPKAEPALVKPSNPDQRPMLKIQPRSKPVEIVKVSPVALPAGNPEAAVPNNSPPAASPKPVTPGGKERPKLNLKPRSKPAGGPANPLVTAEERKSSVFGSALPREVVLNKRGESVSQESPLQPSKSAGDSGWHTVHHHRKTHHAPKPHSGNGPVRRISSSPVDDPFFCDYSPPNHSLSAVISSFEAKGPAGGFSGGPCSLQMEDEFPFMKRSLPTRTDGFF